MSKLSLHIDENIKTTYKEMEQHKYRYFLAQIDKEGTNFNLLKTGDINSTLEDFKKDLPDNQCICGLFLFDYDVIFWFIF